MRLLAVVVVYNPDMDMLRDNISRFIDHVDRLLVWRNSRLAEEELFGDGREAWKAKTEFCGDGTNVGIPKALNHAWCHAREHGYTHILTMDQDSLWEGFGDYLAKVSGPKAPRNAIFGANYRELPLTEDFTVRMDLITSGMIVPVEVVTAIGGWREDFFVDSVDIDLCYHAANCGYTPYIVNAGFLVQCFGVQTYKPFLWGRIGLSNYSPFRLYGMFRNNLIVIRSYKGTAPLSRLTLRKLRRLAPRILLGEEQRFRKLWAIARGLWDGLTYKV